MSFKKLPELYISGLIEYDKSSPTTNLTSVQGKSVLPILFIWTRVEQTNWF